MHTVVFGWFGGSAVWFLPLLWRLVKSVLPGGVGLRGPGTIRLWLGFVCVLVASCTLEASLLGMVGMVGVDGFGHALAAGFGRLLGHVGTPLVMLGLLVVSLPWLLEFRWSSVALWADSAFGLGLSRGLAKRDEDARRRSTVDDTLPPYASTPTNTMAPKTKGRYARPTVWRPPAATRGAGAGAAGLAGGKDALGKDALGGDARAAGAAPGGAGWQARNATPRGQAAAADQAGRTRAGTPARQGAGPAPAQHAGTAIDKAAPWAPAEPVAPAGWLREPGSAARGAAVAWGVGAGTSGTAAPSKGIVPGRVTAGAAPASPAAANRAPSAQHVNQPVRPGTPSAATPASRPSPAPAPTQTQRPVANAAQAHRHPAVSGSRAPSFSRPAATTEHVTPPASVQETLRSIEENAARWTTIAGASLARRTVPEAIRFANDVPATPVAEDVTHETPTAAPAQAPAPAPAPIPAPTPTPMPASEAATADASSAPLGEPAASAPVTAHHELAEPVSWPIVSPEAGSPVDDAPVDKPIEASAQVLPAAVDTPAHIDSREAPATPNVDHASAANAMHAPAAELVIDKALAPWETEVDAATPPSAPAPTPSNVVRFPGFAAANVASIDAQVTREPLSDHIDNPDDDPLDHVSASTAIRDTAPAFAGVHDEASDEAIEETFAEPNATPQDAPTPAPFTLPRSEPANEPIAPRAPVSGHTPTVFEFRAPAASRVELPTLDLLARADTDVEPVSEERLAETGQLIEQRLQEFKVPVTVVGASAGPVITRFEVEPALGVRGSQIVGLMKDLSRGLGLTSIRVVETIPGKTCMGLELPNAKRQTIRLSEILEANVYQHSHSMLTLAMGKDITGHPVVADLAKAPHMLVAGTTGSGKSVAINAMIVSLLYKATPEEVRLIMIDPKMLELSVYEGIPHLLAPVVTDMKLAANALNWCVGEMEKRYRLMSAVGVRNLAGFNQKIRDAEAAGKKLGNPFSLTPEAPEPLATLPLIVVVIDELADLMMVAGKKIEELIARLAQKARAAGIHLILATQRPSVDVITGLIKANIPTRVAFQVSSKIDSRTILDQMGAESLLGQGDMLFLPPGTGYPQRVHGAFVADEEVHRIVEYLKQFGEPQYEEGILDGPASEGATQDLFGDAPDAEADPLYDEAVAFVVRTRRASISSVQRQLRIGYNRAARLVEQMETAGLVSSMGINGSREVLAPGPAE